MTIRANKQISVVEKFKLKNYKRKEKQHLN